MDKQMILNYVKNYGTTQATNIDQILQPWEEAKGQYLKKIFGDQLILEKDLEFEMSKEELAMKFSDLHYNYNGIEDNLHPFFKAFKRIFRESSNIPYWVECDFNSLTDSYTAADNKISDYESYGMSGSNFMGADGSPIKIIDGMRYTKALKEIAKSYGIMEEFEQYRLDHSRILNNKRTSGTLCLSIHPLDFMTMSDNNNNWSSCMSWTECGCYRTGTLEMMNSPMVLVAYLKSKDRTFDFGSSYSWNSKKWRTLIIVNQDILINNKSYPYANTQLEQIALAWIKELVTENLGWSYEENVRHLGSFYLQDREIRICPHSHYMYNDFECNDDVFNAYIGQNVPNNSTIDFNFSGQAYCLICGQPCTSEEYLTCHPCRGMVECESCGDWVDSDDVETFDDAVICHRCRRHRVKTCAVSGVQKLVKNMSIVYVDPIPSHEIGCPWRYDCYTTVYICKELIPQLIEDGKIQDYGAVHEDTYLMVLGAWTDIERRRFRS